MFDDKLKTAPKGFASDHEFIEMLKYKSFAFTHKLNDDEVLSENFIENIVQSYRQLYKVNVFLNIAMQK